SPRWLLANGKIDEVEKLLVHGAERNHRSTKTIRSDLDEHMSRKALLSETDLKEKAHGTLIDLFKYPNLRIRTLVMGFNWLVCGLTYFGVSQYIGEISGNIFVNVAISGMIGIPGTLISIPATKVLGRKKALILSNCVAGISLLLIAVLGKKGGWVQVGLASIGVFGMSVSFPNVYLYGGELFPTVARN
uniref:Major facilitator superfamily (MFS) profile domain-containing protein n=1 Tax=Megaselia scalaris TaxID=36166 RepID=T1GCL2_MEGSC